MNMRIKLLAVCALCLFLTVNACREAGTSPVANNNQAAGSGGANTAGGDSGATTAGGESGTPEPKKPETSEISSGSQPKTVRDFFMLLPEKYFLLEGCEPKTDKDCRKARLDYLKTYVDVEDTQNGYLSGGCDGAQRCLTMALFKRPDGTYLIGVNTSGEMMVDNYFLDYRSGNWTDVSSAVVPQFSRKNEYELPRYGTTVKVFAKKVVEKGDDYEATERGEKLYDLEWKDSKFSIKK